MDFDPMSHVTDMVIFSIKLTLMSMSCPMSETPHPPPSYRTSKVRLCGGRTRTVCTCLHVNRFWVGWGFWDCSVCASASKNQFHLRFDDCLLK